MIDAAAFSFVPSNPSINLSEENISGTFLISLLNALILAKTMISVGGNI